MKVNLLIDMISQNVVSQTANSVHVPLAEAQAIEALLNYLWESYGFDFTGYKRPSLIRQIRRRMQGVALTDYSDYIDYLKEHPEELKLNLR